MSFKLEFKLKQHTPIIHFQHDHDGATLRATELKPKLDQFIFEKLTGEKGFEARREFYNQLFNGTDEQKAQKLWLVGKGRDLKRGMRDNDYNATLKHFALDYKVRITSQIGKKYVIANNLKSDQQRVLEQNNIPFLFKTPYFAQEKEVNKLFNYENRIQRRSGRERTVKVATELNEEGFNNFSRWGIETKPNNQNERIFYLQIICFHSGLLNKLRDAVPVCLAIENFGTRQSKGFGSITIEKKLNGSKYSQIDFENELKNNYAFVFRKSINVNNGNILQEIFETIQSDYKILKSGRNPKERAPYVKSKLFLYGVTRMNPIRWEKRKIKKEINASPLSVSIAGITRSIVLQGSTPPVFDENDSNNWEDSLNHLDYRYLRAVLGLAEQFELLSNITPINQGRRPREKYKNVVQINSRDEISRYRCPLMFKIFENHIYIVGNDVHPYLLSSVNSRIFDFELKLKKDEKLQNNPRRNLTSLMTPDSFNLYEFIDWALDNSTDEKIAGYKRLKPTPEIDK